MFQVAIATSTHFICTTMFLPTKITCRLINILHSFDIPHKIKLQLSFPNPSRQVRKFIHIFYHLLLASCLLSIQLLTSCRAIIHWIVYTVSLHHVHSSEGESLLTEIHWFSMEANVILCHISAYSCHYSGPCILRQPLQPDKYGLKLEVVLKWRDIYTESIRMVLLIAGLKMEGIVKWRGLK